ncbi:MAG: terminase family protein [Bryobacteraceae bacterium]
MGGASGVVWRELGYRLLPSQRRFFSSKARFKGFSGPVGSGKTLVLCSEAVRLSYRNPGRTGLIGSPTYPMLRDATIPAVLEYLEGKRIPYTFNRSENHLVIPEIRSKILFRAVEEFERLRGSNLAWFGVDELTYTSEEAWLRLEGRLRDPKATELCGFAVWTPKGYDWVYERFIAAKVEGYETILAEPFENRFLLDQIPDYYERLKHSYDARFYEQEVLGSYTTIRASASGGVLTIFSRELGTAGHAISLAAFTDSTTMTIGLSGSALEGGVNGLWRTDLAATPRLNRAMRDWTRSFLIALNGYGIDAVCAFSTEIKHGDPSPAAGIAQRDSAGDPILLPTPALQTNFSPTSLAFWKQVHADCAQIMDEAGITPYLQFGEEQWWYFPHDGRNPPDRVNFSSMPFYDAWTTSEFVARYGHAMAVFVDNSYDPSSYPDEMDFLSDLIGEFTDAIIAYVRASLPSTRFEVLYPFDVNSNAFNLAFNFPAGFWTPAALDCLKTEGLSLTFTRNLAASEDGIGMGDALGFSPTQRAHLVGLGDSTAPWLKEMRIAEGKGFESVVGFALDQFCLIGFEVPLPKSARRSVRIR